MVLLLRQDLKSRKLLRRELTKVYGLNLFLANQVCDTLGFASDLRVGDLTDTQKERLVRLVQRYYVIGPDLKHRVGQDVQHFDKVNSFRGQRRHQGLPVRGQRSRTNSRTSRKLKN